MFKNISPKLQLLCFIVLGLMAVTFLSVLTINERENYDKNFNNEYKDSKED